MGQKTELLLPVMTGQPVIPVIKISRLADAVPLARALARGGLKAIEITLRTPVALDAIRLVAAEVEEAVTGAGTILNRKHFEGAVDAGAEFIVSPGLTPQLVAVAEESDVPLLPGSVTSSEIMTALEAGYSLLKFFPAEQAGGAQYLKSLSSPLAGVRFCPTGGITEKNAATHLGLPNVLCVGGSWVAPDELVADGKWGAIEELARQASKLGKA
jgi:2-dehydro-3-deoxyphosphogluconate aldolase/(4S)-4-hydroxy-2-oxoglutarate aldolase